MKNSPVERTRAEYLHGPAPAPFIGALERMIHLSTSASSLSALVSCTHQIIAGVAVWKGTTQDSPGTAYTQVPSFRMQFTNGSALEVQSRAMPIATGNKSYLPEAFVPAAIYYSINHAELNEQLADDNWATVEPSNPLYGLRDYQFRDIEVCSQIEIVDRRSFRIDSALRLTLDEVQFEIASHHQLVMPMYLGIRRLAGNR